MKAFVETDYIRLLPENVEENGVIQGMAAKGIVVEKVEAFLPRAIGFGLTVEDLPLTSITVKQKP